MKRKTNVEFITDLMEFSQHGAMMQAFVMNAIEQYAQQAMVERLPDKGFISPDLWQAIAKELLDKLEVHYGS